MGLSLDQILLCALAAVCVGLAKGGFGGAGMLAVLLMATVFPARESTGALLPMLITGDVIAVRVFHAHADWRVVAKLLPPAVLGIVSGWWLMPRIPDGVFARLMGGLVLALLVLVVLQRLGVGGAWGAERKRIAWPAGWLSGVTTMLANAAGPVTTLYLLACRLPKMAFVGTSAWFYFVINLAKAPFSASLGLISAQSLLLNALAVPLVVGGVLAGRWLLGKVNQQAFEWLMIAFSAFGALHMLRG